MATKINAAPARFNSKKQQIRKSQIPKAFFSGALFQNSRSRNSDWQQLRGACWKRSRQCA
jgi:hypothetical protein